MVLDKANVAKQLCIAHSRKSMLITVTLLLLLTCTQPTFCSPTTTRDTESALKLVKFMQMYFCSILDKL